MSISANEFLKMSKELAAKRAEGNNFTNSNRPRIGFFSLKDDGDEAIVRLNVGSLEDLEVHRTHSVTVGGKFRKVACLREMYDTTDKCPLCASGNKYSNRIYIPLIEYHRDEEGNIVAEPKIWERSAGMLSMLNDFLDEYGSLRDICIKVKRNGAKGSQTTTYSMIPTNATVYNETLYKKDFSAFDDYKVLGGPLMKLDFEQIIEQVDGMADFTPAEVPAVFTPTPTQSPVSTPARTVKY